MLTCLYRLIWHLLNFVLYAIELIRSAQTALRQSHDNLRSGKATCRNVHTDCAYLKRCQEQLKKLPHHIAIIVGADERRLNEEVLSDFFTYALIMDVSCISYYDTRTPAKGQITLNKLRSLKSMQCQQLDTNKYIWQLDKSCENCSFNQCVANGKHGENGVINGRSKHNSDSKKSLEIFEITKNDGRPLIADVCRSLFENYHSTGANLKNPSTHMILKDELDVLLSNRDKLIRRIDEELTERLGQFTEPDLGIIFSRCMCTYGMLPWHTRFTEFHSLEAGRAFNAKEFANILCKYSRCEQRWGQ